MSERDSTAPPGQRAGLDLDGGAIGAQNHLLALSELSVSTTAISQPTRANRLIGPVRIVSGSVEITDRIPAVASVALKSFLDGRRWPSAPALTRRRQLRCLQCVPRNGV